jgi:flap endonuclease-1
MIDNGVKPAYVFDGKPPELKSGTLKKRFARREEATEEGAEAKETGPSPCLTDMFNLDLRADERWSRDPQGRSRTLISLVGEQYE